MFVAKALSWLGNILHVHGYLNPIRNTNFNFQYYPNHEVFWKSGCRVSKVVRLADLEAERREGLGFLKP